MPDFRQHRFFEDQAIHPTGANMVTRRPNVLFEKISMVEN